MKPEAARAECDLCEPLQHEGAQIEDEGFPHHLEFTEGMPHADELWVPARQVGGAAHGLQPMEDLLGLLVLLDTQGGEVMVEECPRDELEHVPGARLTAATLSRCGRGDQRVELGVPMLALGVDEPAPVRSRR
eukprot:scaffold165413_cov30-Tisochrysis_lutea.AAC.5